MNTRFQTIRSLIVIVMLLMVGCSAAMNKNKDKPKETTDLRVIVTQFHLKMRWGQWEQASAYLQPEFRNRFSGRYEEYGDDYKITELEVKTVAAKTDKLSEVEVEQRWYHEPNMTVQKDRFMETWVMTPAGWRLKERMTKTEWREAKEVSEPKVTEPETPKTETPETSPEMAPKPEEAPQ